MSAEIWFFGTGGFAARCLEELSRSRVLSLVVTAPPSMAGRGLKKRVSPVEETAAKLNLPLRHSALVNKDEELLELFASQKPELIFVVDFGQKVGEPWLSGPKRGCLNIHPSLLPLYRGAAPVQRAIMDGAEKTGVTLFRLVEKMDAGPVWVQGESPILPDETSAQLLDRMAALGCRLFEQNAGAILGGTLESRPQDESKATTAPKIDKSEARLSPDCPAERLSCLVRGLNPAPGAYLVFRGKRVKILRARAAAFAEERGALFAKGGKLCLGTSNGALELVTVQPEGKKPMPAADWLKGLHLSDGEKIDA